MGLTLNGHHSRTLFVNRNECLPAHNFCDLCAIKKWWSELDGKQFPLFTDKYTEMMHNFLLFVINALRVKHLCDWHIKHDFFVCALNIDVFENDKIFTLIQWNNKLFLIWTFILYEIKSAHSVSIHREVIQWTYRKQLPDTCFLSVSFHPSLCAEHVYACTCRSNSCGWMVYSCCRKEWKQIDFIDCKRIPTGSNNNHNNIKVWHHPMD